jgi:hypothetical protein
MEQQAKLKGYVFTPTEKIGTMCKKIKQSKYLVETVNKTEE